MVGLEPTRVTPLPPQSSVSTSSTTSARKRSSTSLADNRGKLPSFTPLARRGEFNSRDSSRNPLQAARAAHLRRPAAAPAEHLYRLAPAHPEPARSRS